MLPWLRCSHQVGIRGRGTLQHLLTCEAAMQGMLMRGTAAGARGARLREVAEAGEEEAA